MSHIHIKDGRIILSLKRIPHLNKTKTIGIKTYAKKKLKLKLSMS